MSATQLPDGRRLRALQAEVGAWLAERFGPVRDLKAQHDKLIEEVDELGNALDGLLGNPWFDEEPPEGWEQNFRDEVADVVVTCMAIAHTRGFDLSEAIESKWARRKAEKCSD